MAVRHASGANILGRACFTAAQTVRAVVYAAVVLTLPANLVAAPAVAERPILTWPTPAAVSPGTVLGATQLNATANVPGTFVYQPPAGTVLAEGASRLLEALFIPDDEATYSRVLAVVRAGRPGVTDPHRRRALGIDEGRPVGAPDDLRREPRAQLVEVDADPGCHVAGDAHRCVG